MTHFYNADCVRSTRLANMQKNKNIQFYNYNINNQALLQRMDGDRYINECVSVCVCVWSVSCKCGMCVTLSAQQGKLVNVHDSMIIMFCNTNTRLREQFTYMIFEYVFVLTYLYVFVHILCILKIHNYIFIWNIILFLFKIIFVFFS